MTCRLYLQYKLEFFSWIFSWYRKYMIVIQTPENKIYEYQKGRKSQKQKHYAVWRQWRGINTSRRMDGSEINRIIFMVCPSFQHLDYYLDPIKESTKVSKRILFSQYGFSNIYSTKYLLHDLNNTFFQSTVGNHHLIRSVNIGPFRQKQLHHCRMSVWDGYHQGSESILQDSRKVASYLVRRFVSDIHNKRKNASRNYQKMHFEKKWKVQEKVHSGNPKVWNSQTIITRI